MGARLVCSSSVMRPDTAGTPFPVLTCDPAGPLVEQFTHAPRPGPMRKSAPNEQHRIGKVPKTHRVPKCHSGKAVPSVAPPPLDSGRNRTPRARNRACSGGRAPDSGKRRRDRPPRPVTVDPQARRAGPQGNETQSNGNYPPDAHQAAPLNLLLADEHAGWGWRQYTSLHRSLNGRNVRIAAFEARFDGGVLGVCTRIAGFWALAGCA